MKITVYTVSDCQFSKQEKEYLQSHNLAYEEKNLEQNREWLTEMLAVSNNFAGTPVTKIEKDDGQIIVLKGFTQEEFDEVLGFKKEELVAQASADVTQPPQSTSPQPPTQTQTINQPEASPPPYPSSSSPIQPRGETLPTQTPPVVNQAPTTASSQPVDPLSSILSDLEQKANPNQPPPTPPTANIPNIPNFNE
jgi:glutaredoxin